MEKYEEGVMNSQVDVTKTKNFALMGILTWTLVLLAMFSCLWRNDCNVFLGLIIVFTLNRKFSSNQGFYCKVLIHLLLALIIIDCIWMFVMFPYWNNYNNEKLYSDTANALHGWVEFFGILEIFVKAAMIFILISFYKNFGSITGLFNLKYS